MIDNNYVNNNKKEIKLYEKAIEIYLKGRPNASGWVITNNIKEGRIETNWYREHKGEVFLKIVVNINKSLYRVDVRQKVGFIFMTDKITYISRQVEWGVQQTIEQVIFNRN